MHVAIMSGEIRRHKNHNQSFFSYLSTITYYFFKETNVYAAQGPFKVNKEVRHPRDGEDAANPRDACGYNMCVKIKGEEIKLFVLT